MTVCNFQQEGTKMSSYLEEFQSRISQHDTPAVIRLWEEYCSGDDIDQEELIHILTSFKKSDFGHLLGRHVEKIIPLWKELPESPKSKEILRLVVDLETSNPDYLKEITFDYLKKNYGEQKNFSEKFRLVGLRSKEGFQGAISHFELLNHMEKGNFVFHSGGWGVGEILDVSLLREQLSLEFDYVQGKKDLSFANAFKTLIPIPKDHFLALRFGNPDLLEKNARENPLETIRMLLKDLGPKTAAEIKDELCDLIIPTKEWTRWWQNARAKMKKDTFIYTPDDIKEPFRLLSKEISHEERLKKSIHENLDITTFIQTVYSFIKDFGETLKNPEFKQFIRTKLTEALDSPDLTAAQELELHFFVSDISDEKEYAPISELVRNLASVQKVIKEIDILSFKKRIMTETRKHRGDWKEIFIDLLFNIDHSPLRDYLLSELLAAPEAREQVTKSLKGLYSYPAQNPDMFLWYFQKIMANSELPFANKEGQILAFESLLVLLSHLENSSQYKEAIKKIHTLLTQGRYLIVRQIMQEASIQEVQEFLLLSTKCQSLSDHDIKIFHSLAEVVYPSLAKLRKKSENTTSENQVIWMTQEGYQKLQERIHKIATVETVENAREIELARSHGDLRENMEFKAAREKRDRLQNELKSLSDQLSRSRVLTREDVSTEEVGVGAVIECKNKQGKIISYTILGPIEANPDKNILSFQSKLAQTMKGMTVGEKFQFQEDEYTITHIRNFFEN